jgi:hypothetical protein
MMNNNTVYTFGSGILQPALSHRFRVVFNSRQSNPNIIQTQQFMPLTAQVHDVTVDYFNKLLNLNIEQSIVGEEHQLIMELVNAPITPTIRIDILNGNEAIYHSTEFQCKPISHNLVYDYSARSGVITHRLQFGILSMTLLTVDGI